MYLTVVVDFSERNNSKRVCVLDHSFNSALVPKFTALNDIYS